MVSQEQLEEIESLKAVYDGSEQVILHEFKDLAKGSCEEGHDTALVEFSVFTDLQGPIIVSVLVPAETSLPDLLLGHADSDGNLSISLDRLPPLCLRVWLRPDYLRPDGKPPRFELSCRWLHFRQLGLLCEHLDRESWDQGDGPVLFVWLEWLRTDALKCLNITDRLILTKDVRPEAVLSPHDATMSKATEPLEDFLALVDWLHESTKEHRKRHLAAKEATCSNCRCKEVCVAKFLLACGHTLCSQCASVVVQVHAARGAIPCCPLPRCRTSLPAAVVVPLGDKPLEPWGAVLHKVERTPFQEVIVYCPRCERRGLDMPILMFDQHVSRAGNAGLYQCQCFRCHLIFCGICRSGCHPGEACSSNPHRALTLENRRPALPPVLQEWVQAKATEDGVVFCPRCEILQTDSVVFTSSPCLIEVAASGGAACECYQCQTRFCGVCRAPCHPGESCLSDTIRALHMKRRRPPLPPILAAEASARTREVELVFCPRCEDRGDDSEVCIAALGTDLNSMDLCEQQHSGHCSLCHLTFCGICRMPCHPGKSCLSEEQSIEGMVLRRPPLPQALAEVAQEKAAALALTCQGEFRDFRDRFLAHYEKHIHKGLRAALTADVQLHAAPVSHVVQKRFMTCFAKHSGGFVCPGFHGTDINNHRPIFQHGLLIPGDGNKLKVVHGEAYGKGIYVAKVNAAWLSSGFCSVPRMLVCAVIQSPAVLHHRDAMVVFNAAQVVPLFEAVAESFGSFVDRTITMKKLKDPGPVAISRLLKRGKSTLRCEEGNKPVPVSNEQNSNEHQ